MMTMMSMMSMMSMMMTMKIPDWGVGGNSPSGKKVAQTQTYKHIFLIPSSSEEEEEEEKPKTVDQQIFEKSKFTEKSKILHQEIQTISRRNPKKIFPKMLNLRISLNPKKSENPIYLLSENHFIFFLKIKQIKKSNAHAHTLDWCAFALDGVKRLPTNKAFIGAGLPLL